jgi:hypothetical protein
MRILFVGDINIGEYYLTFGHGPRSRLNSNDIFRNVRSVFDEADIIAGNLEAPLTNHNYNSRSPESSVLRGDPLKAKYLREIGFNILQVANNHTVQHGVEGFQETLAVLKSNAIVPVGVIDEEVQRFDVDGISVGFLAASDVPDNTDKQQLSYQRLDEKFIEKIKFSVNQVDHLFVMLHWGLEDSTIPMDYQCQLIDDFKEMGVRGVIGSHPHLFYELWGDENFIAAPSLGNFIFDLCWDSRLLKTGILDITIDGSGVKAKVWPVDLKDDGSTPELSGSAVTLKNRIMVYDLGDSIKYQQVKKVFYFILNLMKGDTFLKLKFIGTKIKRRLRASWSRN